MRSITLEQLTELVYKTFYASGEWFFPYGDDAAARLDLEHGYLGVRDVLEEMLEHLGYEPRDAYQLSVELLEQHIYERNSKSPGN